MSKPLKTQRSVAIGATFLALALLLKPTVCLAWGENAERLITSKAVDTLPAEMESFFFTNRRFLVQHVTDPLETGSQDASDTRNDFIELDHYGEFPYLTLPHPYQAALDKFGRKTIEAYGTLPWQIGVYSQKLTDAMRARNWDEARLDAAILAHYVAAAHDPFNTTLNRDGKLSDQPGVDGRFDTSLIDRYQLFFFVKPNESAFIHDPTEYAFEMALASNAWLDNILLDDRHAHEGLTAYNDEYYDRFYAQSGAILIRQLSDAASDVGSYWMTAWIDAGRPPLP